MLVSDPVCGREFDLEASAVAEDHEGWAYFFCSDGCHARFMASPQRFGRRDMPQETGATGEHRTTPHKSEGNTP
jgi:YHS domain-containing protein